MGRAAILVLLLVGVGAWAVLSGRSSLASALVLGGVALGACVIYRVRDARAANTEQFFGEAGDDTRLTGLQNVNQPGDPPAPDPPR